ncbi:MAG: SDR family oxidoreductase [Alphaproteobacteria bacterium]|nr:SDR family oxidoreductase [Alphaproteobacteria bacterium]
MEAPKIAIMGAGGLIGFGLARDLAARGFALQAFARRFTRSQLWALQGCAVRTPLVPLPQNALARLLADCDIVVNCIGILQDGIGRDTDAVHREFAATLSAVCAASPQKLLIHISVPGAPEQDRTAFSRSKRQGEALIAASGAPFAILRPGFVIAPAAYGGSALMRALASLPARLPTREATSPFAAIALSDIGETVARIAARWRTGERHWAVRWDLMEEHPGTVQDMVEAFRAHGGGPAPVMTLPGFLMNLGILAGDAVAWLGWTPPTRSTAIQEMRRGLKGDPGPWIAATGIAPRSARQALAALPATVQETWFARLYLLKALILVTLVLFWCISSLIALTVGFAGARSILLRHGMAFPLAHWLTLISSCMDMSVGILTAFRRTSRLGLVAGIGLSLSYMVLAAILTPELWVEPLGALVKTGPAIILMLVALALSDDRG